LTKIHKLENILEISRAYVGEVHNWVFVVSALAEKFFEKSAGRVEDESVTLDLNSVVADEGDVLGILTVMKVPESGHHGGDEL